MQKQGGKALLLIEEEYMNKFYHTCTYAVKHMDNPTIEID
jgi:hypothetical protein